MLDSWLRLRSFSTGKLLTLKACEYSIVLSSFFTSSFLFFSLELTLLVGFASPQKAASTDPSTPFEQPSPAPSRTNRLTFSGINIQVRTQPSQTIFFLDEESNAVPSLTLFSFFVFLSRLHGERQSST